jgi:hypothetical protein
MINKTKPKRRKQVRLTREVKDFILEKMHGGMDILTIAETFPDKVPVADTIYKAPLKDKEFETEINDAYTVLLMRRMDELHRIGTLPASTLYPDIDWREGEATLKRSIDTKKFLLGKMAPILSRKFQRTDKLEVSGIENNSIAVINYYADIPSTTAVSVDNKMLKRESSQVLIEQ